MSAFIGSMEIDIYCPENFSLKDKRSVLSSIIERVTNKFNVSVSEIDHQEHHRLSTLAFVTVGTSRENVQCRLDEIEELIHGRHEIQVRDLRRALL
ncbi:MAG: DUF503 domain-containing protein [bacterium]